MSVITALKNFFRVSPEVAKDVTAAPAIPLLDCFDPWTLACAVGAKNGSIGSSIGFDMWLRLSEKNWLPEVKRKSCASRGVIISTLTKFVAENSRSNYQTILANEAARRGQPKPMVLGPGESMTVTIPLEIRTAP